MGTAVMAYGSANVVNNYYYTNRGSSAERTIIINFSGPTDVYVAGNYSLNGWDLNNQGNRSSELPALVPASTTDALTGAKRVVAQAGARGPRFGLDPVDQEHMGQISVQ